jgi:hypothetical protein
MATLYYLPEIIPCVYRLSTIKYCAVALLCGRRRVWISQQHKAKINPITSIILC